MKTGAPARILLAEDALSVSELLTLYLTRAGYAVELAEDGRAALDKFTGGEFDLVITDIQMPVMDGYAAIRGIRGWEKERKPARPVPIIALTGNTEREAVQKCLDVGANAYLCKPIERTSFLALVAEQFGRGDGPEGSGEIAISPDPEIAHLLPRFIENRRQDVSVIRRALERDDFPAIVDLSHKMAGVGTSFGLEPVSLFGRAMELAAKNRDGRGVAGPLAELSRYLARVRVIGG